MSVTYRVGVPRRSFYWRFQEFGTSHQPARPFVRPAVEATRAEVAGKILVANLAKAAAKVALQR